MHALLEMYNNPIDSLMKLPDEYRQLKKVFDYLKEFQPDSLSDLLMDKELDKIASKIYLCDLVAKYKKPSTPFQGDLTLLQKAFEKDKIECKKDIPRRQNWRGSPEGYLYDAYVENLIENNGYNTFIVKDKFELNLLVSYFSIAFKAVEDFRLRPNHKYPLLVNFNNREVLHSFVYSEYPIGTELPNIRNYAEVEA